MRFCEKDADFPVFEVGSTVTYQTPRRAMAVERMLLRLAAELDAKAAERELPLAELFAERLCVPHAAALMDPCFADMRQQGQGEFSRLVGDHGHRQTLRQPHGQPFAHTAIKGFRIL